MCSNDVLRWLILSSSRSFREYERFAIDETD